eukprot:6172112-Pleurochrysis_carterae.AAC.1
MLAILPPAAQRVEMLKIVEGASLTKSCAAVAGTAQLLNEQLQRRDAINDALDGLLALDTHAQRC